METTTVAASSTLRKVPTLSLGSYLHGSDNDKVKFIEQLFSWDERLRVYRFKRHDVSPTLLTEA